MTQALRPTESGADDTDGAGPGLLELLVPVVENLRALVLVPLVAGALGYGASYLIKPTFTASMLFLPPQQQQSAAASALASLGALASLAGGSTSLRTPSDQYVALMQSATVSDRIIDRFKLMSVYGESFRVDARRELDKNARFSVGKKDGLIRVDVDDKDPQRASDMANAYLGELRSLTANLAITEAQQRRAFFETQLQQTRERLAKAQERLEASGFSQGALRAEPKAAAEAYARLRAEATAAEMRLQVLRRSLADSAPEVASQQAALSALREQLRRAEQATAPGGPDADYISRFREFKYQETLFELFARQYELARLDESREGALFQVVDPATPPEKKSKPKRLFIAAGAAGGALLLLVIWLALRAAWAGMTENPKQAEVVARLRRAWGGRT